MRLDWTTRYLALLGAERSEPGLEDLARLVRAHVLAIPFENSGSLFRRLAAGTGPVPPLDPEALLAAWVERRAGGVCFEHTEMFGRLLPALGYDVTPIAGEISFPGSHQALLVKADGATWLVDVGNGAPFLEPIPLDRPIEIWRAGLGYRFRADPADAGVWIQERALERGFTPYCRYLLRRQSTEDREKAYQRHHRARETWVTNAIVLVRSGEEDVISFRDGELKRHRRDGTVRERVEDASGWARLPAMLGLPGLPIRAAAEAWAGVNGRPLPPGAQAPPD